MFYERWIAQRYLWSKRRHPFVGVVSGISVLGIAVGVAALIVVLAVMNGFDEDLRTRMIGTRAHLVIEKDAWMQETQPLINEIERDVRVRGASPFIEGQALLQTSSWAAGVLVRGLDPQKEKKCSRFFSYVREGGLSDGERSALVGSELAKRARLQIGSQFSMQSQSAPKPAVFTVEGIFSSGIYEYDANLVFLNLSGARNFFRLPGADSANGVSVYLKDAGAAPQVKRDLQVRLGAGTDVRSWEDLNRTLFSALKLEKMVMFLILGLIVLVASLNIAGSLTILVRDKTKDLGVLKAIGATRGSLIKIFAYAGLALGIQGAGMGFLIGWGVCEVLRRYRLIELPKEIYYFDRLPVLMNAPDTAAVLGMAVLLSFFAGLYPAWTAGRLSPVKALRYE